MRAINFEKVATATREITSVLPRKCFGCLGAVALASEQAIMILTGELEMPLAKYQTRIHLKEFCDGLKIQESSPDFRLHECTYEGFETETVRK
jgi:hypothetical protein